MWIVRIALNRPYTFIALSLVILLVSPLVIERTPTDVFPDINIPIITVAWAYSGLSPLEMEHRIASPFERQLTTSVDNIEHIESQTIPGRSFVKIFFHPVANISTALGQVQATTALQIRGMPPGTNLPVVLIYSAATVPVLQLGLGGEGLSEQELFDFGQTFIKTELSTVPGAAIPWPFGGKQRLVAVNLDIPSLQAKGLSPADVIGAVNQQNLILPSGTIKMGPTEFNVETKGSPLTIAELNDLPIKTSNGTTTYIRDVATVTDGFSPQTGIVRMDGRRGVLVSIYKTGGASTLDITSRIYSLLPRVASTLPPGLVMTPLFDQSFFVRAAVQGVIREALIAACLTALMILLFLGNWRSTLVIAISIPLSVLVSICVLSALGQTINIMTLGGLALAVGILVDDATVEIENINRNLAQGKKTVRAILDGAQQIAVPAFVSTLCICIVFVPMFFLTGVAKFLFVPLAEAVVFAMLASYVLSRTLVPTLAMYLLRGHHGEEYAIGNSIFARFQRGFAHGFERMREGYRGALELCLDHAGAFISVFLLVCLASAPVVLVLGRDFFPTVDQGLIRLHMRGPAGERVEETARVCDQVENRIRQLIPPQELGNILDNIGIPVGSINMAYSNSGTIGTSDAEILISLQPGRQTTTKAYVDKLRITLNQEFPGTQFFFQPADMIGQVLNFGSPAPIDIQLVGPNQLADFALAQKIANRVQHVPGAVDVHVHQLFSLPVLALDVNRTRAQSVGLSPTDVAQSVLLTLSSSYATAPSFWVNPANGVQYNVAVQLPQYKMNSMDSLENIPVSSASAHEPQLLGNLATLSPHVEPAVISHYDVMPMINVFASVEGRDLAGVDSDVRKILNEFKNKLPRGTQLEVRGQVDTMNSSFAGLAAGIVIAIVLVYLLIVINFQSWLDPFIIITALPGALAGIVWMLLATHTTLSVPALTGTIMCMGVATANSILMVSFARERMMEGLNSAEAALEAGYVRIRPVLMTALAMMIGMAPIAVGIGEGAEQNAPLGRAVIGGLLVATFATLFFVPCVFSLLHRGHKPGTPLGASAAAELSETGE